MRVRPIAAARQLAGGWQRQQAHIMRTKHGLVPIFSWQSLRTPRIKLLMHPHGVRLLLYECN